MTRTSTNQAMNRLLFFAQWHPCKYPCIRPGLVLGAHNVGQHFAYSPNSIHNPPTALSAALFPSQNPTAVYMRFGHGATMLRSDTSIISRQFSPMNGPVASHEHSYHDAIIRSNLLAGLLGWPLLLFFQVNLLVTVIFIFFVILIFFVFVLVFIVFIKKRRHLIVVHGIGE